MAKTRRKTRASKRNRERALNNALARQVEPVQGEAPRRQVRTRTQLEWLAARGVISSAQKEAGERLERDYRRSGSQLGHLIVNYEAIGVPRQRGKGHPRADDTPSQIDARRRFEAALRALGGLAPITIHVCVTDLAPGYWATANGKPRRDGPALVRFALDLLDDHYQSGRRHEPPAQAEAA